MSALLEQRLAEQRAMTCWAVHVLGPDEVIAMPSYEAAETFTANLIAALFGRERSVPDVQCLPVVVPWTRSREAHQEDLDRQAALRGDS